MSLKIGSDTLGKLRYKDVDVSGGNYLETGTIICYHGTFGVNNRVLSAAPYWSNIKRLKVQAVDATGTEVWTTTVYPGELDTVKSYLTPSGIKITLCRVKAGNGYYFKPTCDAAAWKFNLIIQN